MHDEEDDLSEADDSRVNVFDINWSCDGTLLSAGINKSIVLLDLSKILAEEGAGGNKGR